MDRRDWTLLAIAEAGGEPLTPVQLQKSLFLLGKKRSKDVGPKYYKFSPYNYGPFSPAVYSDAEELERAGLVRIDLHEVGRSWREYYATPRGLKEAARIRREAPKPAVSYLRRVVPWTRSLSFRQLVSSIYASYPEQRKNSVFRS